MKQTIQFLYRPDIHVDSYFIEGVVTGTDVSDALSNEERSIINKEWEKVQREHQECYTKPRDLGSLCDTKLLPVMFFQTTDFKTYVSASRTAELNGDLNLSVYEKMRVAAVGAAVRLNDGNVLVHRRPPTSPHVPNKYDSGVAGLAHVTENGAFDFPRTVLEKLQRELRVERKAVEWMYLTAVHSSSAPDLTGTVDFILQLDMSFKQVQKRANPAYIQDMHSVPEEEIPNYVIQNFVENNYLIAEGAAVLLASLPYDQFREAVKKMNKKGKRISFGRLENGVFIESPLHL